jgi:uncharacterized protein (DUF2141 family)
MNKFFFICFGLILISNYAFSQYNLEIEITGIKNNEGKMMLQLFDSKENVLAQEKSEIKNKRSDITIKNLKAGKYAVRYYHDENSNDKMETNLVGKPTEGYGFSNNVIGKFGPPQFEKWLFEITGNKKIVLISTY